jgi:hydrogenase/urease accessory protein HupE
MRRIIRRPGASTGSFILLLDDNIGLAALPMRRVLLWLCLALVPVPPASAHPAPFSYVDVRLSGPSLELTVTVHEFDAAHDLGVEDASRLLNASELARYSAALTELLKDRLQVWVGGQRLTGGWSPAVALPDRQAIQLRVVYDAGHPPPSLILAARLFPYDPVHQTFVNVYEDDAVVLQAILVRHREQIAFYPGTRQGTWAVVKRFAASGVHHILIGPDHLLFLVGLLLLGGTLRRLVLVVSAFTIAHSLTLSLAVLRVVTPPPWLVEPAIALSIVYVGADNLTVRAGRDVRGWIAFAFGLIHGFGFANVLREMDLPPRALGWSLLSFNLGVEIGQLAVVIVVASILSAIRSKSPETGRRLAVAGSAVVIAAGTYWFVQRVFFAT